MTVPPNAGTAFLGMAGENFVSLTTFRKSGKPVSTPVWIARDGAALIVTTPADSGKVKRLRKNSRVELQPSSRRGVVPDGAQQVSGTAEILTDPSTVDRFGGVFLAKYKLEYRLFMLIERLFVRGQKQRVMLRISEAG